MTTARLALPTDAALAAAAHRLGCDESAIRAVAEVEAPRGAWLPSGEPEILFEAHKFGLFTGHKHEKKPWPKWAIDAAEAAYGRGPRPGDPWAILSRREWKPGTYGPLAVQHARMQAAASFDRDAALRAASWGLFQILGDNWRQAGFESLQAFVNAMYRDVDAHLEAFVAYILADGRLSGALRQLVQTNRVTGEKRVEVEAARTFAVIYNGPQQSRHDYHGRIVRACERWLMVLARTSPPAVSGP